MELSAGQCRYLLSIYQLSHKQQRIRCADIARDLGITRPSVSKMAKYMVQQGMIEPNYCENVRLTKQGYDIAKTFTIDYDATYAFFHEILKLSPEEAKEHTFLFLSAYPTSTVKKLGKVTVRSLAHAKKNHHQ